MQKFAARQFHGDAPLKFLLDIGGLLQMGMTALWLEVLGK
jgi:hypothetical protein